MLLNGPVGFYFILVKQISARGRINLFVFGYLSKDTVSPV